MPIDPNHLRTGGALQGAVAASLLRQREAAAELTPGAQVDIYRVLREIGRGGMAIVYLAKRADGEYEQQVALKWMQGAQQDAAAEALFRRERQALADLRHPHIARLLDGGRSDDGRPWFAMEYIEGEPLDRHCVQARLPLAKRLTLFQQVCAAVAFAHARGVIHRDIKPSNVLVDSDGSAKLLDFGIAQLLGQDDALATRAYTPGFASPEQLRGETPTVVSDVYQLGRLLASILGADDEEREALALREAERVTATQLRDAPAATGEAFLPAHAPADLRAIMGKACALDPAQRYAGADALSVDISAFLGKAPVTARPRHAGYIAQRFVQRHPVAVACAALALAVLVGGTALFTVRLKEERDTSRAQAVRAEAVSEFLVSLFRDSDPTRSIDPGLPVRDLVTRGTERLLADRGLPASTRNALTATLLDIQISLGQNAPATQLLQQLDPASIEEVVYEDLQGRLATKRGEARDAVRHLTRALELDPNPRRELLLARAQSDAGDTEAARRRLDDLLTRLPSLRPALQSSVLNGAGVMRWRNGQPGEALALLQRAGELRDEAGRPIAVAAVQINSALALIDLTRYDEAMATLDTAQAHLEQSPNAAYAHMVLQQRGIVHFRRGEIEAARRVWEEMRRRTAEGVDPGRHAGALHNLATTYEGDETHTALSLFLQAAAARDALGDRPGALSSRVNTAFLLSDLYLLEESEQTARRCEAEARDIGRPDLLVRSLIARAKVERMRGSGAALTTLDEALALLSAQENLIKRLQLHEHRARAALRLSDDERLQRAVDDFLHDAEKASADAIGNRASIMRALISPQPERELIALATQGSSMAATLAVEAALAHGRLPMAVEAMKHLEKSPDSDYWTLIATIAQRRGRHAERAAAEAEAEAELQRLQALGHEVLVRHRAVP